ncbi:MAG: recombinase family protein [Propionibacteriaceae bacterium]|jgi:DNA invertase Pin-like site-specific DNA recombinase|nr:recombinase family protein [Propionibacteriaceae bacterium]
MNINQIHSCAVYARLSVSKEESVSIERQLQSCRRYAEARGWTIIGEFVDDGVSATANRPEERAGWQSLLATSGFEAVVIWKVDRLARRVLDFLHADETLQSMGAGLVAVDDPIDMTSPQGRAFAVMLAVFGEMEAEATRARVRAARAQLLKVGRWPGGGIPYGYMSVANPDGPGQVLAKHPTRITWLEAIVAMASTGQTINHIARWLTEQQAPVPGQRSGGDTSAATIWHRQTVVGLLRNPILAGMRPHNPGRGRQGTPVDPLNVVLTENGDPLIAQSLALMSFDEFVALQSLLDSKSSSHRRRQHERTATSPFLSRVIRCDDCDVYLCRGANQGHATLYCPKCRQTMSRPRLDAYLIRRLLVERGGRSLNGSTVRACWAAAQDDTVRRQILLSQLESLRIKRGMAGRYFDKNRVELRWHAPIGPTDNT